jgi:lipoprotein signal peptidase
MTALAAALAVIVADWIAGPVAQRTLPTITDARLPSIWLLAPLALVLAAVTVRATPVRVRLGAAILVGGAAANVLDRTLHGPVVDWIPAPGGIYLDLADVAIMAGVAALTQAAIGRR